MRKTFNNNNLSRKKRYKILLTKEKFSCITLWNNSLKKWKIEREKQCCKDRSFLKVWYFIRVPMRPYNIMNTHYPRRIDERIV